MYPWTIWELVPDPLRSAEHTLGTTGLHDDVDDDDDDNDNNNNNNNKTGQKTLVPCTKHSCNK